LGRALEVLNEEAGGVGRGDQVKPAATGLTIPWPLIGLLGAILSGVIWLNVQVATMNEKVEFLWTLEMARHPREGPSQLAR